MTTNPYSKGIEHLAEAGIIRPTYGRVLLKAIMRTDGSDIQVQGIDTKNAVCHEVVAADEPRDAHLLGNEVQVGMHVIHISTAGDAPDWQERESRFCIVREQDIIAYWWPDEAIEGKRRS